MKNSLALVVNLTPTCTELARHLVLSGINIHLVDDGQKLIEQSDVDSDFLFSAGDIGRKVSLPSLPLNFSAALRDARSSRDNSQK